MTGVIMSSPPPQILPFSITSAADPTSRVVFTGRGFHFLCLCVYDQGPGASSDGFFQEQLMAFQVWLQFAGESARDGNSIVPQRPPEKLPVVLQALLSQVGVSFGVICCCSCCCCVCRRDVSKFYFSAVKWLILSLRCFRPRRLFSQPLLPTKVRKKQKIQRP